MAELQDISPDIPLMRACDAVGLPRATVYRARRSPTSPRPAASTQRSPLRLSDDPRDRVYAVLTSSEFADQPPPEVFATLLSRGEYVRSIRTMYRILHERDAVVHERRQQRAAHTAAVPRLAAAAPNQVWAWDITKLAGPDRSQSWFLYSVLDIYSRYVVGWMVADRESAALAPQLLGDTCTRHGITPSTLTIHSDRGAPMTSHTVAQLLADLGVARSFSRPRTSNDNPQVESSFKTMKYQPTFPTRFDSLLHARGWLERYFDWYHHEHHHSGLALFTPADVFHGRVDEIVAVRQRALDAANDQHPERFLHGRPIVRQPAARVVINPLADHPPLDLTSEPNTAAQSFT